MGGSGSTKGTIEVPNSEWSDLRHALNGVTAVMVAPFKDGDRAIDANMTERLAARLAAAGVHALTVLGNTGEVFQLTETERRELLRAAARGRERGVLIAGIAGSAIDALRQADEAAQLGYDAVMLHDPPDPLAGERGIMSLIHGFAERSPLPTVLYVRTPRLGHAALLELAAHQRIIGVKYARHELAPLGALLAEPTAVEACSWVCGLAESMVMQMRGLGVVGFTSGIANVRPDLALGVWKASRDANLEALRDRVLPLLPFEELRNRTGGRHNVAVVKEALHRAGFNVGGVRPPCESLDAASADALGQILSRWPADTTSHVAVSV